MNDVIKRWADFSSSETKPLFWMLLGPLLMLFTLTLSAPYFSNPFLPLIAALGLILSWRYRLNGFMLTLMMFVLYFGTNYFLGPKNAFLWQLGWGSSLAFGLTISFLSMEELKCYYARQKSAKEEALNELQISLCSFEEKSAAEIHTLEKEIDTFKEELQASRDEVEALLNLVEASRIESNKIYQQNDALSAESLKMHREIKTLKITLSEREDRLATLEKEHHSISEEAATYLKSLNTHRVDLLQSRLLNEKYEEQIKKARAYFLAQKKPSSQEEYTALQTLEKNRGALKKLYNQNLEEYKQLKETDRNPEAKKKLEQTKAELIGIEREVFIAKKRLQEKGAYAS